MDPAFIAQRVALQRAHADALSRQLYGQLKAMVLGGALPPRSRLPATRALAAALGVSRNTVVEAFAQLQAEGVVETNGRGGTRVVPFAPSPAAARPATSHTAIRLSARGVALSGGRLDLTPQGAARNGAFSQGVPDLKAFPHALFARLLGRAARLGASRPAQAGDFHGYGPLRDVLAAHLAQARAISCTPDQIVIVPGAQAGLDLIARLLLDDGDTVWTEDPCYRGALAAFRGSGAALTALPVDDDGITLPPDDASPPRLIYMTPSHQFPLAMVTSLPRRLQMIEAARRHNAFIIEDDYDSEFRSDGQPIAALQGLDGDGRVIYLGSFAKTMLPSLRVGYMVLPARLAAPVKAAQRSVSAGVPLTMQAAIADFLAEGHYRAHVRRMRLLYEERRKRLGALLGHELQTVTPIAFAGGGMQAVLHFDAGIDDTEVAMRASAKGIDVFPLSRLALRRRDINGLLLGFGNVAGADLDRAARRLAACIR